MSSSGVSDGESFGKVGKSKLHNTLCSSSGRSVQQLLLNEYNLNSRKHQSTASLFIQARTQHRLPYALCTESSHLIGADSPALAAHHTASRSSERKTDGYKGTVTVAPLKYCKDLGFITLCADQRLDGFHQMIGQPAAHR